MSGTVQTLRTDLANPGNTGTQFSKRKRVLIAESDGFTRMVLMLLFRMIGFGVDFTANGLIALGKLRAQPPDALLLELNLSGLAGLELIRWVRNDPQFSNLRIYVFTDAEAMKRAVRREVQLNVTKVFDKRAISREDVVKNIILDLSSTEMGIRLHTGPAENRTAGSSKRMVLPGEFAQLVEGVRAQANAAAKCKDPEERLASCRELLSRVSSLRSCAEVGGLRNLERYARGLAGFLNQLCRERKACTDGRLNTVRCSVEVLGLLSGAKSGDAVAQFSAVIIDESSPSSKSLSDSLAKMGVNAAAFAEPARALDCLASNWVNLVVVNVPLPQLHGLDLASIRRLPLHATTPVIFVSDSIDAGPSKEPPSSVPLVNQNPLLLHEVVLLALNEVHSTAPVESREVDHEPLPSSSTGPIPFGSDEGDEATDASGFSSSFAQSPADLQAWETQASADGEVSAPTSQPDNGIPEETTESGEGQTTLFVQNDETQTGDIVAEDQVETPSTLPTGAVLEDLTGEQASQLFQTGISDAEIFHSLDQQIVSEPGSASSEGFSTEAGDAEAAAAMQGDSEPGASAGDVTPATEPSAAAGISEETVNEPLEALQQECAELREALTTQENERETLVNRIFASENELHCSQAQVQEYQQAVGDLQKQLEEVKARQPGAEVAQSLQELESELKQRTAELEQVRSWAEEQAEEHERIVAELRRQLAASEAEVQQIQERCAALEQELAALRQAGETVNSQLAQEQQANAEATQRIQDLEKDLSQRAAETERAGAEAKQQAQEHQERCAALEQELAALREAEETVNSKLAEEQQANVDAAQRIKDLEKDLSQHAAEAERAGAEAKQQAQEHQERSAALERELAALREAGETANSQLAQEQQANAEAAQRIQDLEKDLSQRAAEAERAGAEAKQQAQERQRAEAELRRQLEEAAAATKQTDAAHKQVQSRVGQLEAELAGLHQIREEADAAVKREQEIAAELRAVNKDLEKQLQSDKASREAQTAGLEQQIARGVANLARVTAALSKETGERQRSDERAAALNLQLQELHAQSGRFLESQRADHERIANLEAQLRQRDETLTRCTGELEQHKSEGRLVKEQLQKTQELNAHFRKNLSVFKEAHQKLNGNQKDLQDRLESVLDSLEKNGSRLEREMAERQRLAAALEGVQRDLQAESRKRESLEGELRNTLAALKETKSKADRDKEGRQHLQQALESARLSHRERSRRAELELSKAQSALEFEQVERKRREAQVARMRLVGLEAMRRARWLRNTLQKQTREPLDNLYQSARRLLQLELGEDQKKLAEAMLQDALLVRTRLQEPERAKGDSKTPCAEPGHDAEQPGTDEFSTKFIESDPSTNPIKSNER